LKRKERGRDGGGEREKKKMFTLKYNVKSVCLNMPIFSMSFPDSH
jgi:hypothetical protein